MENLKSLHSLCDEIAECKDCVERIGSPWVFKPGRPVKIVFFSDGPYEGINTEKDGRVGVSPAGEPIRAYDGELIKNGSKKSLFLEFIRKVFGDRFIVSGNNTQLYWMHYRKCVKGNDVSCADKFLGKEFRMLINEINPKLIIVYQTRKQYAVNFVNKQKLNDSKIEFIIARGSDARKINELKAKVEEILK